MTGRERIMRTLEGIAVQPVPMMLHSFLTAAAQKGFTQAEYRSDPIKIARSHIDFARKYGLDGVFIDVDTCLEASAIGVPVDYPENEPARVLRGLSSDLDLCIDAMDKEKLLRSDRIRIVLEAVNLIAYEAGGEILIRGNADQGPFSLAMLTVGMTDFFMNLADEGKQEKTKVLIERALEVHLEFHRLLKEAGSDVTSFGDSSCGPDLISRQMYMEFSHPYHVRLARSLNELGIISIIHICGNLDRIFEDVASAGFPAIEVDYKTNIRRAKDIASRYRRVIFGPIDPAGAFLNASTNELAETTLDVLEVFEGKGLVIGAGCALPPDVSEENLRAFTRAVRSISHL